MTPQEIREARLAAGLTLRQAGDLIYVTEQTFYRYEKGTRMNRGLQELFRRKLEEMKETP